MEGSRDKLGVMLVETGIEKYLIGDLELISSVFLLGSLRIICSVELESRCLNMQRLRIKGSRSRRFIYFCTYLILKN